MSDTPIAQQQAHVPHPFMADPGMPDTCAWCWRDETDALHSAPPTDAPARQGGSSAVEARADQSDAAFEAPTDHYVDANGLITLQPGEVFVGRPVNMREGRGQDPAQDGAQTVQVGDPLLALAGEGVSRGEGTTTFCAGAQAAGGASCACWPTLTLPPQIAAECGHATARRWWTHEDAEWCDDCHALAHRVLG